MAIKFTKSLLLVSLLFTGLAFAAEEISMKDVMELARAPVDEILAAEQIEELFSDSYWKTVRGRNTPLIVFFYSNKHDPSQRVATLIKYVSPHYANKISFARLKVGENGTPDKALAGQLRRKFSLDQTPGILFYDNVGAKMVLEDEDYIDADFKEFRTPSMFLWKVYYSAVRKELDALLSD